MGSTKSLNLNYSIATLNQLDEIFSLYKDAIALMNRSGIYQWDEVYPDKQILAEDIEKKQMFIGKDEENTGKIVVCFVINEEWDEQYQNGKWNYPDAKFCVVHRLCVNSSFQHCGVAKRTMDYIEKKCKSAGYDSLRLDCFTENPFSRRLYDKAGYSITGYAQWRKGRFELREKKI